LEVGVRYYVEIHMECVFLAMYTMNGFSF